jgi:hypothetical protein
VFFCNSVVLHCRLSISGFCILYFFLMKGSFSCWDLFATQVGIIISLCYYLIFKSTGNVLSFIARYSTES